MRRSAKRMDMDERLLAIFWENLLSPSLPRGPRPDFRDRNEVAEEGPVEPRTIMCWWCREYHSPLEVDACMALPRKDTSQGNSTSSTSNALVAGLLTQYSEIWAFLTVTRYPDGKKRQTGRLSLSCESGQLKLSCTDEETGQYVCLSFQSLDEALLAFETGLAAGDLPWRESRYKGQAKRK